MISKRQQLEQWTTVVADTGDLERIAELRPTMPPPTRPCCWPPHGTNATGTCSTRPASWPGNWATKAT
jgi:hypothetical protein